MSNYLLPMTSSPPRSLRRTSVCIAFFTFSAGAVFPAESAAAEPQTVPDFGLILNHDGDQSYPDADPKRCEAGVRRMIATLDGTPVKTLAYSIGAGSDILYYPTKVASNFGWRSTPLDDNPMWSARVHRGRAAAELGIDPVRAAGEQAHAMGMRFIPSYRMNDMHFVEDPQHYPLTGRFWMEHQSWQIGTSPVKGWDYSPLFDFAHPEVREFRLKIIFEAIERYSDLMDGLELDFVRFQVFFRPGEVEANAHLITEMLVQVRARLREEERKRGRMLPLLVRVPPALRNCHWAGLEVETWMQEQLVDVVMPSQYITLAHDMPVDEFVAAACDTGCKIYPSLYDWTHWRSVYDHAVPEWPFQGDARMSAQKPPMTRLATPALVAGAISNYHAMGADGFQMYNYRPPLTAQHRVIAGLLSKPAAAQQMPRIYEITHGYFHDQEDSFQYKKQLPVSVPAGCTTTLRLFIGEAASSMPPQAMLRLGVRNLKPARQLKIAVNGHALPGAVLVPAAPQTRKDTATAYLHLRLDAPRLLLQGWNEISIASDPGAGGKVTVSECQVGFEK